MAAGCSERAVWVGGLPHVRAPLPPLLAQTAERVGLVTHDDLVVGQLAEEAAWDRALLQAADRAVLGGGHHQAAHGTGDADEAEAALLFQVPLTVQGAAVGQQPFFKPD